MSLPITALILVTVFPGCSRTDYRRAADSEAYRVIAERNGDPRWKVDGFSIDIDPRSRIFDPHDPDQPPMPPDDPAAHRYLREVDGKSGWQHWHRDGVREAIENPGWRRELGEYVELLDDGSIRLDEDAALALAYLHSPFHQQQLETVFLSALDVTRERFRLDSQFFGGHGGRITETDEGSEAVLGGETAGEPTLGASKLFAAGGELLVNFANSFVFLISGDDPSFSPTDFSASLVNLTFIQPLLRGAGRDVTLERLTRTERNLLGNLRSYSQFRQGFYTQVVIGELGVDGPRRAGPVVDVSVFRGNNFVGGYLGLLFQLQRIRNTEDNLSLQLRMRAQLEAYLEAGLIDLVQVDQFRQSIEFERANLLADRNRLEQSLDEFKTSTLGLPPDLPVRLDDGPIRQFRFVSSAASRIQDEIARVQGQVGALPGAPPAERVVEILEQVERIVTRIESSFQGIGEDLDRMGESVELRESAMDPEERQAFREAREQLRARLEAVTGQLEAARGQLETLSLESRAGESTAVVRAVVVLLGDLLRIVQGAVLIQARARLESITVEPIQLDPRQAFRLALAHRLDFMNARSALVDSWRSIQISADALRSGLDITATGELRTSGDSAVDYRSPRHTLQLGVELDTPFLRIVERNDYRTSLINYQRSRRSFIQSRDALHLGLRALLRDVEQLRVTLEIQRRAVVIAIRRVDLTRAELDAPVRPPQPGQRPNQLGPTAAINLLSALSSLRDTQNSFLGVWLDYYAARLRLFRELGILKLDGEGRWEDSGVPLSRQIAKRVEESLGVPVSVPPSSPEQAPGEDLDQDPSGEEERR